MHFWGWEQVEKHHVRLSIINKTAIAIRIPELPAQKEGIAGPSIALQYLEANKNVEVARDALGMMYSGRSLAEPLGIGIC